MQISPLALPDKKTPAILPQVKKRKRDLMKTGEPDALEMAIEEIERAHRIKRIEQNMKWAITFSLFAALIALCALVWALANAIAILSELRPLQ